MRGTSIALKRSLRTRVTAASFLALMALSVVICVFVPHAYRVQESRELREEAEAVARAVALRLGADEGTAVLPPEAELAAWATTHPALDGVAVLAADGTAIARWPAGTTGLGPPVPGGAPGTAVPWITVSAPVEGRGDAARVAVRTSTAMHREDASQVQWLFGSIFLLMGGVFVVLTRYVTQSVLQPLEVIGRAAQSLADGEPMVTVPETGDREIDELGDFIARLGRSHASRAKEVPTDVVARRRAIDPDPSLPRKLGEETAGPEPAARDAEPTRPADEEAHAGSPAAARERE